MKSNIDDIKVYEEKSIKSNTLVIKNINIDVDSYEFKIFDEIKSDNILKFNIIYEEGKQTLIFNINNDVSLHEYLKYNKLKRRDLIFIIKCIYGLLISIENYLIDEGSIFLDVKSIMLCKDDNTSLKFCVIPSLKSNFSYELSRLLVRLLRHVDTTDTDALNLAYNLFLKSSKANYSIQDLMQVIEDVEKKEYEDSMAKIEYENINNYNDCEKNYINLYDENIENGVFEKIDDKIIDDDKIIKNIVNKDNNINSVVKENDENDLDIEIDSDTKKDLNIQLFDEIDNDLRENRKKSRKKIKKKIFVNANIKFHIAILPIIAIIVPIIVFLIFGMDFLRTHILTLVFYEIIVIFIIVLNSFLDMVYSRL